MADEFVGRAQALSADGLRAMAARIGVDLPKIWAVLAVETSGCGFLADRRPRILYERHLFHELTNGTFDDGDISDPQPGGYGATGAHQYDRLARAIQLDRTAALMSTSWGLGQILGKNCRMAGFADVELLVKKMIDSEDSQADAMAEFVRAAQLDTALREADWAAFARGYNGPNYAENNYDVRLNSEYQKAAAGMLPEFPVRSAQLYLQFRGIDVGAVDGILGPRTRAAIIHFQTDNSLAATGEVDQALLDALLTSGPIKIR
jgi:hypothetical protein